MSVTGILHAVHTSPPAQEAINQTQKFVVELKTLFFLSLFYFIYFFVSRPFCSFSYRREAGHGGGLAYKLG